MNLKYWGIATDLREAIANGTYPPGSKLPAIPELMAKYKVARDTVRDAVGSLVDEGLVTPMRGVGTVVREVMPVELSYDPRTPARTWAEQLGAKGATDVVVSSAWEPADHDTAERLKVPVGDSVVHRLRHQTKGGGVAQIHEQWIPEAIVKAIAAATGTDLADKDDIAPTDLFSQMRQAEHNPAETTEVIGARMPDPEERDVMGIPSGVPVLVTKRVTTLADGTPVETSTMVSASDRMTQTFVMPLS